MRETAKINGKKSGSPELPRRNAIAGQAIFHLGPPDQSLEAAQFASGPRENGLAATRNRDLAASGLEFAGSAGPILTFS